MILFDLTNKNILMVFCLLFNSIALAQEFPEKMIIGTLEYSSVSKKVQPILKNAYARLGIETTFIPINMGRSIKLLKEGKLDAELIRSSKFIEDSNNTELIRINVPLINYGNYLICNQEVSCTLEGSIDEKVLGILTGDLLGEKYALAQGYSPYYFSNHEQLINVIRLGRISYGLIYIMDKDNSSLYKINYLSKAVLKDEAYHYIHKRYAYLVKEIEASIKKSIKIDKR